MRIASKQLAQFFRDMASRVENGDSFEGNVIYTYVQRKGEDQIFELRGAVRVGNSQGQGGMKIFEPEAIQEELPSPHESSGDAQDAVIQPSL